LKLKAVTSVLLVLAALSGLLGVGASVAANTPQASTSVSFTLTTTSNYPAAMAGVLQVSFDSIQLTTPLPQAYSFGVVAKTVPGLWITRLVWQFGDGSILDLPYCCQSQISDVRYHTYAQQGSYTVIVIAYDNAGNFGDAVVTVNWTVHAPEFYGEALPLFLSLLLTLILAGSLKGGVKRSIPIRMG
jgi:hypothetical protein